MAALPLRGLLRRCLLLAAPACLLAGSRPAGAQPQGGGAAHLTRSGQRFTELETSLLQAAAQGDEARLAALLADDFEMIVAQDPGNPVPREDWLRSMRKPGAAAWRIEELSVHEWGTSATVSFRLRRIAPAGAGPVFVIDTWQQTGEQWRLAVRHAAVVAGSRRTIPGDAVAPTIQKQY